MGLNVKDGFAGDCQNGPKIKRKDQTYHQSESLCYHQNEASRQAILKIENKYIRANCIVH
jgi:hypothetical protein